MAVYLGLGSNLGDRRENLRLALAALAQEPIRIDRISPVVESPALLPRDAPADWNRPFLNLAVECRVDGEPSALLATIKRIEQTLCRNDARRWAPRPIDIDILLFDDRVIGGDALTIPHPALAERAFVLTPLTALAPRLAVPGHGRDVLGMAHALGRRIPLWMGIVNLTPDSFSDGGLHGSWAAVEATIDGMLAAGAHILDFGAESTRPGAKPLTADAEWARLEPVLGQVVDKLAGDPLRPLLSIDTYHADVAARAIAAGADLINDVGGLTDPAMIELAAMTSAEFVAMHNLGLPADRAVTLPPDRDAVDQVLTWLDTQIERWTGAGIDPGRILFDPGIGFGKTALQSLEILRRIDRFAGRGQRLLVGHSRKSFMQDAAGDARPDRDLVTIGGSLALAQRGVDILRVHDVGAHALAWRGWAGLQPM